MRWIIVLAWTACIVLLIQGERLWFSFPISWLVLYYCVQRSSLPFFAVIALGIVLDIFLSLPLGVTALVMGALRTAQGAQLTRYYRWIWLTSVGTIVGYLYLWLRQLSPTPLIIPICIAVVLIIWRKDTLRVREI